MSGPPAGKGVGFTLNDLDGRSVSLGQYKGSVVLVTFFTTWCPSCQDEMPKLEVIYEKYHSRNFNVIGVNIKDTPEEVKDFARENKLTFTLLLDEDGAVTRSFKVRYIPRSFLYDENGDLKFSAQYMQPEDIENEILKLIK